MNQAARVPVAVAFVNANPAAFLEDGVDSVVGRHGSWVTGHYLLLADLELPLQHHSTVWPLASQVVATTSRRQSISMPQKNGFQLGPQFARLSFPLAPFLPFPILTPAPPSSRRHGRQDGRSNQQRAEVVSGIETGCFDLAPVATKIRIYVSEHDELLKRLHDFAIGPVAELP